MNEYTTAKIDGYENLNAFGISRMFFSFPDAWYLSILNYPSATEHLMLIRIHASSKKFFIYDPVADRGQKESIRRVLFNSLYRLGSLHFREQILLLWVEGMIGRMLNVMRNKNWIHTIAKRWF
jgi:hypothetical protein